MSALRTQQPETGQQPPAQAAARDGARAGRWPYLPPSRLFLVGKTPFIMGVGAYVAGGPFRLHALSAALGLASLLWLCLYALNESSDAALEQGASVSPWRQGLLLVVSLLLTALAACVAPALALLFLLMIATQVAYSLPPLRWKRHWGLVVLISGVVNPVLRLECGALFGQHAVPALGYATLVLLHVSGALRTRLLRKRRDLGLGYRTVPDGLHLLGAAASLLGIGSAALMCRQGLLPPPFWLLVAAAVPFSLYAWSGRAQDVTVLRRAWVVPLALLPPVLLWLYR